MTNETTARAIMSDENRLLFIDLETTGLHTSLGAGILELCLYNQSHGHFSALLDPGRPIPARITEITGIDRDMIAGAPMFPDLARSICEMLRGKIVIGHNVAFDLKFLYSELLGAGITPPPINYVCTCESERLKYGVGGNRLQQSLARRCVYVPQAHRAKDDVEMVRQLLKLQSLECLPVVCGTFDESFFHALRSKEPAPRYPIPPKKRTTHSLRVFDGWGSKSDDNTINDFNRQIEQICQDRVLDSKELSGLSTLGISKICANKELKKAIRGLVSDYYDDGRITWNEYSDLEDIAQLFGLNNKAFFALIREVVPSIKVACFTNDLVVDGQVVDRYETLFPWATENGFLPSTTLTKNCDIVINCGEVNSTTGKIEKAKKYGIPVCQISDLAILKQLSRSDLRYL